MKPLPTLEDDLLYTPEVGPWAEQKYRLIWSYAEMFATSMKTKWRYRVYIDAFSGAGHGRVKGTGRITPTSSLLALGVPNPFDRYIFCDLDEECIQALRARALRSHPDRDVQYIVGDANELVDSILKHVPPARKGAGVLSFCVLDPRNLSDLRFSTIERLSRIFVDFLVLIPSYMDAHRNEASYSAPGSSTLAEFVGNADWREERKHASGDFGAFVVDQFGRSMKRLGFIYAGPGDEVPVHLPEKNIKLYHLAFYSKNQLGMKFWREARKSSTDQLQLFD